MATQPTQEAWEPQAQPSLWRITLLALGILALVTAAYWGAVHHPFVYDDVTLILKNPEIRSIENIPKLSGFSEQGISVQPRWTRDVTYALEYAMAGPQPHVYHRTNIILHGLVALLVFALIARLARDASMGFWAAAVFAVHPIATEVVAHVAGRRELLAAFFGLSALLLLERYVEWGGRWRVGLALVACYLSAFSKEVGILIPLAFILIDCFVGYRCGSGLWAQLARRKVLYTTLVVFTVAIAAVAILLPQGSPGLAGSPSYYDTTGDGLSMLAQLRLAGLGVRLLFVPLGQSVDYSWDALGLNVAPWSGLGMVDLGVLLAATVLAVVGFRRRSWIGFAGAWFLLFFMPHMGLIRWHEIFAERFLYLPAIGLALALAAVGTGLARIPGWRNAAGAAGCAVLALLLIGTWQRNEVWSSSERLWANAVARYPTCARAHKALADAYLADAQPAPALKHYQEAARLLPTYRDAHVGVAIAEAAQMDLGQALRTLEVFLKRWPDDPKAWNLKGYIHQSLGDPDAALAAYKLSIEKDPSFAEGYNNLAWLYVEQGDLPEAIRMYHTALAYDPSLLPALKNLAVVYRQGYHDEAQAKYYDAQAAQLVRGR